MSKKILFLIGLSLFFQLECMAAQQPSIQSSDPTEEKITCYDEEVIAESSDQFLPGYSLFESALDNFDKLNCKFARFDIYYDAASGIGHLVSRDYQHSPKPEAQMNLRQLVDWLNRISFYKEGLGWTKLTLEDAKTIFGEPHTYGIGKKLFYTFDAFVNLQRERQLFHLDMRFDSKKSIEGYRVRGIGIRNPQWVNEGT